MTYEGSEAADKAWSDCGKRSRVAGIAEAIREAAKPARRLRNREQERELFLLRLRQTHMANRNPDPYKPRDTRKGYLPHQGKQECERRARRLQK